jgi:hypothetical protein
MDEAEEGTLHKYGPIITVAFAFFIGELGDKTQLTAFVLSSESNYPFFTLIGTTLGMAITGMLGILLGIKLGKKVPEIYIKVASSIVFFIFGVIKINGSMHLIPYTAYFAIIGFAIYISVFSYLFIPLLKSSRSKFLSGYLKQAETLKQIYDELSKKVDDICLNCRVCGKNKCLIGLTKKIINDAKNGSHPVEQYSLPMDEKNYNIEKVKLAYHLVVKTLNDFPKDKTLLNLKQNFEKILSKK